MLDALRARTASATSWSISAITSPLLRPGLGVPVKKAEPKPLNRSSWVGPLRNSVRTSDDTGTISPSRPRT